MIEEDSKTMSEWISCCMRKHGSKGDGSMTHQQCIAAAYSKFGKSKEDMMNDFPELDFSDIESRSKSQGGGHMPDSEQNTLKPGYYQRGEQLFKVDNEGKVFEMDFDNSIKNNIEVETDMKDKTEKPDEQTTKTEDIEDNQSTSENLARETVDICRKEYDFLKSKYEELKTIQEEKATVEQKLEAFKEDFKKLKESIEEERAAKAEEERVKKVEQIAKDFDIPKEKLEGKSLDMLVEYEEMLDLAIKRNAPDEQAEDFEVSEPDENAEDMIQKMLDRYKMNV